MDILIFYDANKISYGIKKMKNDKLQTKNVFSEKIVKNFPKKAFFGLFRPFRPQIAINCADINGKQWKTIYK